MQQSKAYGVYLTAFTARLSGRDINDIVEEIDDDDKALAVAYALAAGAYDAARVQGLTKIPTLSEFTLRLNTALLVT